MSQCVHDAKAKAEAHFNAYQTELERRDFDAAMKEFIEAIKLDAKRYAPFPVGKYHPLRILGAGGFGTAFLCRHKYMNAEVVVKALHLDALGRDTEKVFTEAQVLRQLDHPAIIRISECGYVDATTKGRPHIIMDYFHGQTLEGFVKEHGPFAVEDLLAIARQAAEGLQAAHSAKILHRDVKPANLLVRKEVTGWKVKIIDFGLAMPQKVAERNQKSSTANQKQTMIGSSIAGTLDYGAPEQLGRRNEPVAPYFNGHSEGTGSVALSPDGKRAVSASEDDTARIWDVDTGKELYRCEGHTGGVIAVAFLPDGKHVLTGSRDKTLRLWRLPK